MINNASLYINAAHSLIDYFEAATRWTTPWKPVNQVLTPSFLWYMVEYRIMRDSYSGEEWVYDYSAKIFHHDPYLLNNYNGGKYFPKTSDVDMDIFVDYFHFLLNSLNDYACNNDQDHKQQVHVDIYITN